VELIDRRPLRRRSPGSAQRGLTLIELLVSIVIGLVVVGAVSYLYIGSRGAYRGNESLARIQEAGRFALDSISRDVRRAGALGCGSSAAVSTSAAVTYRVVAPAALPAALTPINGLSPASYTTLPATGYTAPTGSPATYWGGDVLTLQIGSGTPVRVTGTPDPVAATIPIANNVNGNFKNGDIVLLGNCSAAAVFKVVNSPATTTSATALQWFATGGTVPGLDSSGSGIVSFAFDSYATVQHFDQVTYFVGVDPYTIAPPYTNGRPALYRYSLNTNTTEELVENVEDMDIVYGIDTTPTDAVVSADVFKHAGLMVASDWPNVVSVRVSVMTVGDQFGAAPPGQQILFRTDPTLSNATAPLAFAAPDTRLRQVFAATAALRDRLN
jgi:type IV pilus assembly protein PilW